MNSSATRAHLLCELDSLRATFDRCKRNAPLAPTTMVGRRMYMRNLRKQLRRIARLELATAYLQLRRARFVGFGQM